MNTEKCQNCIWLYNGFCTCEGLKPCTKAKLKEKPKDTKKVNSAK